MGGVPPTDDTLLNSDSDSAEDGTVEYAYDAAAERKKELEREAKKAAKLRAAF
ncbi:hypothetical protein FRB90_000776 [Tulasnella sp. 427]|nr:hypothetical protein FRB90_000776 [Tulasnella sp. 427]